MKITTEIDVRSLPPPEPFEKIMHALQTLPAGTELLVLIHREPFPLYEVMRDNGFVWHTRMLADGNFKLSISRQS